MGRKAWDGLRIQRRQLTIRFIIRQVFRFLICLNRQYIGVDNGRYIESQPPRNLGEKMTDRD
jgi:hypothetical protein